MWQAVTAQGRQLEPKAGVHASLIVYPRRALPQWPCEA